MERTIGISGIGCDTEQAARVRIGALGPLGSAVDASVTLGDRREGEVQCRQAEHPRDEEGERLLVGELAGEIGDVHLQCLCNARFTTPGRMVSDPTEVERGRPTGVTAGGRIRYTVRLQGAIATVRLPTAA